MLNHKKSVKLSLFLTYFFMLLLAVITFVLPSIITWYVEIMKRSSDLATVVMLAYYPCMPIAAAVLFKLRKLLKNLLKDNIFTAENVNILRFITICCATVSVILLLAGFFYMPFYFLGAAAAFCALMVQVFKNILHSKTNEN